jgi:hypothetical protein
MSSSVMAGELKGQEGSLDLRGGGGKEKDRK